MDKQRVPYGYCHCGCGKKTNICNRTYKKRGWIKGQPFKYIRYHATQDLDVKKKLSENQKGEKNSFYKRNHTEEAKNRMSIERKGRVVAEETKIKISEKQKGKYVSKESRIKISIATKLAMTPEVCARISERAKQRTTNGMKGKHHTEETRRKISEALRGDKHPCWQGGITIKGYCPIWNNKGFKLFIKDRDGNRCKNPYCKGNSKRLSVHHINYDKQDCIPFNLITVCTGCNTIANRNREYWQILYTNIVKIHYINQGVGPNTYRPWSTIKDIKA
jgi:hypothetical protein